MQFYFAIRQKAITKRLIDSDSMNTERSIYFFCPSVSVSINKVQMHGKDLLLVNANVAFFPRTLQKIRISRQRETAPPTRRFEGKPLMYVISAELIDRAGTSERHPDELRRNRAETLYFVSFRKRDRLVDAAGRKYPLFKP